MVLFVGGGGKLNYVNFLMQRRLTDGEVARLRLKEGEVKGSTWPWIAARVNFSMARFRRWCKTRGAEPHRSVEEIKLVGDLW